MIEEIRKTREYLDYLEEHYNNIQKAFNLLCDKCKDMRFVYDDFCYFTLYEMVKKHDKSKLSEHEFVQYRKAFYPTEEEEAEEKNYDMSQAWEHHKINNEHHWEAWTTVKYLHPYAEELHCVHMVIDWVAMGFMFDDTAQDYYEKNKDKIKLPELYEKFIYEIFERINNGRNK